MTESFLAQAVDALVAASPSRSRVIHVTSDRGEEPDETDLVFLVVEPDVVDPHAEMARLSTLIGRMGIPAEVIVASEDYVRRWQSVQGSLIHDALTRGTEIARS